MNHFWAVLVSSTVLVIGIIHLYWGHGGLWPGVSNQDLVDKVYGRGSRFPSSIACYGVGSLLIIFAMIPHYQTKYTSLICYLISVIFLLRGVGGFIVFEGPKWCAIFRRLNRKIYSPLCILLAFGYVYLGYL